VNPRRNSARVVGPLPARKNVHHGLHRKPRQAHDLSSPGAEEDPVLPLLWNRSNLFVAELLLIKTVKEGANLLGRDWMPAHPIKLELKVASLPGVEEEHPAEDMLLDRGEVSGPFAAGQRDTVEILF